MRKVWNPAERQGELMAEVDALRAEVEHLRDRERRVVRVFWRVRVPHRADWVYQGYRKHAWQLAKKMGGKVYRVTVRRKAKT